MINCYAILYDDVKLKRKSDNNKTWQIKITTFEEDVLFGKIKTNLMIECSFFFFGFNCFLIAKHHIISHKTIKIMPDVLYPK